MGNRYELKITNDADPSEVINTFTWGESRDLAHSRTVDRMGDGTWDGYSFELAEKATKIQN